jgi:hypothetical protein
MEAVARVENGHCSLRRRWQWFVLFRCFSITGAGLALVLSLRTRSIAGLVYPLLDAFPCRRARWAGVGPLAWLCVCDPLLCRGCTPMCDPAGCRRPVEGSLL